MPTLKFAISFYFRGLKEDFIERLHRLTYMRKLRFTIRTADLMFAETKRKCYVVHDLNGDPTLVTNAQIDLLKAKKRIPPEWNFTDLDKHSLYIPFQLKPGDLAEPKKNKFKTDRRRTSSAQSS